MNVPWAEGAAAPSGLSAVCQKAEPRPRGRWRSLAVGKPQAATTCPRLLEGGHSRGVGALASPFAAGLVLLVRGPLPAPSLLTRAPASLSSSGVKRRRGTGSSRQT